MMFKNRQDAGEQLALKLEEYKNSPNTIVLGLPRGGVVTAYHIAKKLNLPLDIIVTRKINAPGAEEFAIGAIDETGEGYFNQEAIITYSVPQEHIDKDIIVEKTEALRRLDLYRKGRDVLNLQGKTVILADDGIATGATMIVAIRSARKKLAQKIVVAVPVLAKETINKIKEEADELIYLDAPFMFMAVGQFYKDFGQVGDDEVIKMMNKTKS